MDTLEQIAQQSALHRHPATHPLQVELREVQAEIRRLRKRQAALVYRLKNEERACEVCGTPFRSLRATKKHCSQACSVKAHALRARTNARYDLDLIRQMLPLMEASELLPPRTIRFVQAMLDGSSATVIGENAGVTSERVGQLLAKATRTAKLVKMIHDVEAKHQGGLTNPGNQ